MARRLIPMTIRTFYEDYFGRLSCNGWYTDQLFITDIQVRQKIVSALYVLTLSDDSEVTVDGNTHVEVELY